MFPFAFGTPQKECFPFPSFLFLLLYPDPTDFHRTRYVGITKYTFFSVFVSPTFIMFQKKRFAAWFLLFRKRKKSFILLQLVQQIQGLNLIFALLSFVTAHVKAL